MRAVNEGDLCVLDAGAHRRPLADAAGERRASASSSAPASPTRRVLAERELAFLHPVARSIGGPAVRNMGTIGGNLFAPAPFGDFATALLALDATVQLQGGYSPRETPMEEFLASRERNARRWCCRCRCRVPPAPRRSAIARSRG